MNHPATQLTPEEIDEFRAKTTDVVRKEYLRLRRAGSPPAWSRLVGGPLDGVPNVCAPSCGVIGWCKWTERGVVVVHYRYDEQTGQWRFSGGD